MTPEQRKRARIVVFWRWRSPIRHWAVGVRQEHVFGAHDLTIVLDWIRRAGGTPLYAIRMVEVRRRVRSKTIRAWRDEKTGTWWHQVRPPQVIVSDNLTHEERAHLLRAGGGITPGGEPRGDI